MLRASVEMHGEEVELTGIVAGADAMDTRIPAGAQLIRFADSIVLGSGEELNQARKALHAAMGHEAVADAAGVTGFFECVNRIADCTGLPLDDFAVATSKEIRDELGLNSFSSAVYTLESDESSRALLP